MKIRKEQIRSLTSSAFPRKLQQWAREFRTELPEQTKSYSDDQLNATLARGSKAAQGYGLTSEAYIREYLSITLRTGETADGRPSDPSVREVMEDRAASETEKMDRIAKIVPDPAGDEQDRIAIALANVNSRPAPSMPPAKPDIPIEARFLRRRPVPEPDDDAE